MALKAINRENARFVLESTLVFGKSLNHGSLISTELALRYHHATFAKGGPDSNRGENPELRLLFYRVASMAKLPILPLFVFDGRERPKVKRGSKMGKTGSHNLTDSLKKLLDVFGMEWRMVSIV